MGVLDMSGDCICGVTIAEIDQAMGAGLPDIKELIPEFCGAGNDSGVENYGLDRHYVLDDYLIDLNPGLRYMQ